MFWLLALAIFCYLICKCSHNHAQSLEQGPARRYQLATPHSSRPPPPDTRRIYSNHHQTSRRMRVIQHQRAQYERRRRQQQAEVMRLIQDQEYHMLQPSKSRGTRKDLPIRRSQRIMEMRRKSQQKRRPKSRPKSKTPRVAKQCSICLSKTYKPEFLVCGHEFHKKCIEDWLKNNVTCPMCRAVILQKTD